MKRRCVIMKFIGLCLIGAVAGLSSCRDDFRTVGETSAGKTHVKVTMTVQCPDAKASRGALDPDEDEGEYELGFTEAEHQINSLTLIMMQVSADGTKEVFEASQTLAVSGEDKNGDAYKVTFDLTGYSGTKRFYVGANMEQKHIGAFTTQNRVFDAGEGEIGHNIVGSLMTVNHEGNDKGVGSNIVMTGVINNVVIDNNPDADITIDDPVKLTRTVAKVLLTCVPADENNKYVNVVDAKDASADIPGENTGWIRFDHVNYMLNVLNRKTYLDYREETTNGETYLVDPNYKMSELIGPSESGTYGIKDLAAYRKEFLYYDTQQMVEMLNTDVQEREGITEIESCITRQATVYEDNRVGANNATSTSHYTEGLYCTENMVYNDIPNLSGDDFQSANRYVTTRIMIGAKYTPKKIYVAENNELVLKDCKTEEEAQGYLKEQTDGGLPGGDVDYLDGTFWRCIDAGNMQYYSLSGMKHYLSEHKDAQFERFDGGWGYYYTYIDGENQDGVIGYDGKPRWGIKRNHYYILKVEKIIAPGSPFPGNETMRIHSELLDWVDKGESEVEVKVPQKSDGKEGQP